jgi:ubiquinol-cytochrome c reductase cytochrome c1 subunit
LATGLSALGLIAGSSSYKLHASGDQVPPPAMPWNHDALWQSFDYASVRRGFQVYRNVCANCHSISAISYRHLINVCLTEEEAKALAEGVEVTDGPNDEGEMFERPGRITDPLPKPYANKQAAAFANNGAVPPDLSLMTKARVGYGDYVYALLTGYRTPPEGVVMKGALHYNPYFPGGAISMAQALSNGMVEYDDGTEATISQMAKDVTVFLSWVAEPEQDERKLFGLKTLFLVALALIPTLYYKNMKWSVIKSSQIRFWRRP